MYSFTQGIFNIVMVVITIGIVYKFLNVILKKKKNNMITIVLWLLYIMFQIIIKVHNISPIIWITIGNIVLTIALSFYGYELDGFLKIFTIILFHFIWSVVEFFAIYSIMIFQVTQSDAYLVGIVVSTIIMTILTYLVMLFWNKHTDNYTPFSLKYNCLLMFIPIGSIYIAICYCYSNENHNITFTTLLVFTLLLLFNLIVFEIYKKIAKLFWMERESFAYSQQVEMYSKNVAAQNKAMKEFQEEKHNWINKLIVFKNNLQSGNSIEVMQELDEIIKIYSTNERISDCGNNTLDAVLNYKYSLARENGISFNLRVFVPIDLEVNQCDLGIVLGNALDNAIEATQQCVFSKKEIDISIGIKKGALIILIKNPYEHSIIQNKVGTLVSTKNDTKKHGYGLNSIKKIIDKYGGQVIIDTNNHIFSLTIIMQLEEF